MSPAFETLAFYRLAKVCNLFEYTFPFEFPGPWDLWDVCYVINLSDEKAVGLLQLLIGTTQCCKELELLFFLFHLMVLFTSTNHLSVSSQNEK